MMKKILSNLRDNWIKYGFETLAVTVGILGAFALENWQDERLQEQELIEIYKTISEDLHSDILALDTLLVEFERNIDAMIRILTEPLSVDDWRDNDSLARSFQGYPDFLETQRGLNLLKTKIAITGETGILAGRISNFYDERLLKTNISRGEFKDFFYDNMKFWIDDSEWVSLSLIEGDFSSIGEYVKDNPNFRNRISIYMALLFSHTKHLKIYKEEGAVLMDEINTFLDDKL